MKIRIGLVGCGAIASDMHAPAILRSPDCHLAAVVDNDSTRAKRFATEWAVEKHGQTLDDIVQHVDALILCTPPNVRPKIAIEAFGLGLHVLCEKPMANTATDCRSIIDAAQKAHRVLAVAHHFRHFPSRREVKRIIVDREFGGVLGATATQGNPYSWGTFSGYNMRKELVPGGVLFDAGIHPLDTLIWWFGDPKVQHYEDDSLGGLESNVRANLSFDNGVTVRFRQSRTAPMTNEFRVEFERAKITLSNYSQNELLIEQEGKKTVRSVASDFSASEDRQLWDFIDSILSKRPPEVTGEDGRFVIEFIENCYDVGRRRGSPASVPLPGLTF
jgi:predicted dehydrogenase